MSGPGRDLSHLSIDEKRALLARLARERASRATSTYPLSEGQKALWFIQQSAPSSAAYNVAVPVRILSPIDAGALRASWQTLVDRHSILRTTYPEVNGEPVSEVHGSQEAFFEQVDAAACAGQDLVRRVSAAYAMPFDLAQGPLCRAHLFAVAARDHVLLLTFHHIVCDFLSVTILLDELLAAYEALRAGTRIDLPAVTRTYADYVRWQTDLLTAQGSELAAYWRDDLTAGLDELPVLDLPADRPRPRVFGYHGGSRRFHLPADLVQRLRRVAGQEDATLYTALLAAFQAFLYRYTGQDELFVGSPTAGRTQAAFARTIGYFVNPVVIRASMGPLATYRDLLKQARTRVLGALARQDYPFPRLVTDLQPARDPGRPPLFQASFGLHKLSGGHDRYAQLIPGHEVVVDAGELSLAPFDMPQQEGHFDLTLEMVEGAGSVFGSFKYNADLFDHETVVRMAEHFVTLLGALADAPDRPVQQLPLMTPGERERLIALSTASRQIEATDACVHQLFERQAALHPESPAVEHDGRQLTYGELNRRANGLAGRLRGRGVGPDVRVGLCVERSLEMIVGLLGILKAGGAYVPLDPSAPRERLRFMIEDAGADLVLTRASLVSQLPEGQAWLDLADTDTAGDAPEETANPSSGVRPSDLVYCLYTSGSTGQPKGVAVEHRHLVNYTRGVLAALDPPDAVALRHGFDAGGRPGQYGDLSGAVLGRHARRADRRAGARSSGARERISCASDRLPEDYAFAPRRAPAGRARRRCAATSPPRARWRAERLGARRPRARTGAGVPGLQPLRTDGGDSRRARESRSGRP